MILVQTVFFRINTAEREVTFHKRLCFLSLLRQYTMLNVITLAQAIIDNIEQIITVSDNNIKEIT